MMATLVFNELRKPAAFVCVTYVWPFVTTKYKRDMLNI